MTLAKANNPEITLGFVEKFSTCSDVKKYYTELREQGFAYYLNVGTCHDMYAHNCEYRIIGTAFFISEPLDVGLLKRGANLFDMPVLETHKYSSDACHTDLGYRVAKLDNKEIIKWLSLFTNASDCFGKIQDLV